MGITFERAIADLDGHLVGPLLEAFVANEVVRQLAWTPRSQRPRVFHYRQTSGPEVDLVVEGSGGQVVAIEVKAQATRPSGVPSGMRTLAESLGARFTSGLILYTGSETVQLDDRIWAVPIDALWSTGEPLQPSEETNTGASLVGDAQVFWSYAHADDDRDAGRIRRLADAVVREYEFLTGGEPLNLFIDEDLAWGDRWRDRIDTALDRTSLFVAVLSPTYLRRPECQRELETFLRIADAAGDELILLPLLYGPLPETDADPVVLRLIERVRQHQWFDVTELRFEEETSAPWRRMVNQLAVRLRDAAESSSKVVAATPPAHAEVLDAPDLAELYEQVDRIEPAMRSLMASFETAAQVLQGTLDFPPDLPPARLAQLLRTAGREAAVQLEDPLDEIDAAIDEVDQALATFEGVLTALVTSSDSPEVRDLLQTVADGFGIGDSDVAEIAEVRPMLQLLGQLTKELRAPMRRLDRALTFILGVGTRLQEWERIATNALA